MLNTGRYPSINNRAQPVAVKSANMASDGALSDVTWYPVSGVTNHVTKDANDIHQPTVCSGTNIIYAANGDLMRITHTGKSSFKVDSNQFMMNDILTVPSLSKNLLFVKRFCQDNHVYVEFDAQTVRIRDKSINEVLIRGSSDQGLYQLPIDLKRRRKF